MATVFSCSIPIHGQHEMEQALLTTLDALLAMDESLPFRMPVDIPDYKKIIKNPMDLSTIKLKLKSGDYRDPWEYIEDIWLMIENAWIYNRKQSKVYHFATTVR